MGRNPERCTLNRHVAQSFFTYLLRYRPTELLRLKLNQGIECAIIMRFHGLRQNPPKYQNRGQADRAPLPAATHYDRRRRRGELYALRHAEQDLWSRASCGAPLHLVATHFLRRYRARTHQRYLPPALCAPHVRAYGQAAPARVPAAQRSGCSAESCDFEEGKEGTRRGSEVGRKKAGSEDQRFKRAHGSRLCRNGNYACCF